MKKSMKSVKKHLKGDIKGFKKEIKEDKDLLKSIAGKKKRKKKTPEKVAVVMKEFKEGKLHSGSKKGPIVTNPKQAVAIGYSEARKAKKKK